MKAQPAPLSSLLYQLKDGETHRFFSLQQIIATFKASDIKFGHLVMYSGFRAQLMSKKDKRYVKAMLQKAA